MTDAKLLLSGLVPFLLLGSLGGCKGPRATSPDTVEAQNAVVSSEPEPVAPTAPPPTPPAPALPNEIGVFADGPSGRTKLSFHDRDPYIGGFAGTEYTGPAQYPTVSLGDIITLNKVPIDPSQVYWRTSMHTAELIELQRRLVSSGESVPASVSEVEPGVYRVAVQGIPPGFHALDFKSGPYSSRGIILNVK